jgi:hypothetical protein
MDSIVSAGRLRRYHRAPMSKRDWERVRRENATRRPPAEAGPLTGDRHRVTERPAEAARAADEARRSEEGSHDPIADTFARVRETQRARGDDDR